MGFPIHLTLRSLLRSEPVTGAEVTMGVEGRSWVLSAPLVAVNAVGTVISLSIGTMS